MNPLFCQRKPCPVDYNIAGYFNKTVGFASTLRGRYQAAFPNIDYEDSSISDVEKYGEDGSKIIEFYKSLNDEDRKKLNKAVLGEKKTISFANAYNNINRKFSSSDIDIITEILSRSLLSYSTLADKYNVINLLRNALEQHKELQDYLRNTDADIMAKNRSLRNYVNTRVLVEAIKRNYIDIDELFTQIYNISNALMAEMLADSDNTSTEAIQAIEKYRGYGVDAFDAFLWMAKDQINRLSGINFSKDYKQMETLTDEQLEMFEEGVVDGWMKRIDNTNPYDRAGTNMRIFLAGVPKIMTVAGKKVPVASRFSPNMLDYQNANDLHGLIIRATRDCASRKDMMEVLNKSQIPTLQYIAEALNGSEELKAVFWRECNKVRQSYHDFTVQAFASKISSIFKNIITGLYRPKTNFFTYNGYLIKQYKADSIKPLIARPESFTSNRLIIDHNNWMAFKSYVNEHIKSEYGAYKFSSDPAIPLETSIAEFVQKVANDYLGLNVNRGFIQSLSNEDPAAFRSFMSNVHKIANCRYNGTLTSPEVAERVIEGRNREYFKRLFDIIEEVADKSTMTARDKDTDSTYAKDTTPSDLGIAINTIRSFVRRMQNGAYDERGAILDEFKAYIADKYLTSSEYAESHVEEDGETGQSKVVIDRIYNDIVNSLYNTTIEDFSSETSFINEFIKSGERLLKIKDGYRTIAVDSMNETQNLLAFMLEFFSSDNIDLCLSNGGFANYAIFTMGDSSVIKTLRTRIYSYDQLKEQFADVAEQEVQRMSLENRAKKNLRLKVNEDTHQKEEHNIDVSTICSSANLEANDTDNALLTGNFVYLKALNNFKDRLRDAYLIGREAFRDTVKEILFDEGVLKDEFRDNFFAHLDPSQNGKYSKLLSTKEIEVVNAEGMATGEVKVQFNYFPNMNVEDVFNIIREGDEIKYELNMSPNNSLMLYYLNNKMALIQQFQFFKKNPDAYNIRDSKTGEMIPSSVMLQKRFKAENTPGIHPDVTATWNGKRVSQDGKEKVLYFKEFVKSIENTDPKTLALMEKMWGKNDPRIGKYKKTKSTDGQGFRTFSSYRALMVMTDNWSVEKEVAYNRINELRSELRSIIKDYRDIKSINDLPESVEERWAKIIDEINEAASTHFQPIKPHLSGAEAVNISTSEETADMLYVPVEHKYAEALLIPELYFFLNNGILYHLGAFMEEKNIDMACSEECVKVGNWGAVELMYDTDDKGFYTDSNGEKVTSRDDSAKIPLEVNKDNIYGKLSKTIVHEVEYGDYELQTDVPPHYDTTQLIGTQLRKLAFSTILKGGHYDIFSKTIGKYIKEFKVAGKTYSLEDSEGLIQFYNALVSTKMLNSFMGLVDDVTSPESLSDILSYLKSKDAISTPNSTIRYAIENGDFKVPLAEITHAYDNENYLMSLFKKRVNRQKVTGGSFVQVTDLGYDDLETHFDEHGNVTYHDCVATWDLSVTINGREVPLKFSDWCRADGTLKTDENGETLIEKKYPGILDRIAYRIPSERMYSILNLRVKRFVPKVNGGVICVPSYLVTAAGFDFDIDKLYYFKREYNINRKLNSNKDSDKLLAEMWDRIYEGNKKQGHTFKSLLQGARRGANTKYLEHIRKLRKEKRFRKASDKEIKNALREDFGIEEPANELYKYWEQAMLPGTYQQAFDTYLDVYPAEAERLEQSQAKWETTLELPDIETDITEMSTSSLNNLFIDIIQQRIEDINSFDARFTPGGFDPLKDASDMLKAITYGGDKYKGKLKELKDDLDNKRLEDYEPLYDPTNPITSAIYNARNIIAGKVIGIMANHNINLAYSKILKEFKLKVPIQLFGRNADNLIGPNENQSADGELMLAMLLASSVDAVKAPVLNFLNINTYTANVAALLARVGYSGFEIGVFLNQPIIKQVCEFMSDTGRSNLYNACKLIAQRNGLTKFKPVMSKLSEEDLYNNLYDKSEEVQAQVLQVFAHLAQQAQALSDFISETKYTASNSVDNTVGSLVATLHDIKTANSDVNSNISKHLNIDLGIEGKAANQISPILNSYFEGKESKLEAMKDKASYFEFLMRTPFAFEQVAHDCMESYLEVLGKYFPYTTPLYEGIYDLVNRLTTTGVLSSKVINVLNSNIPVFLLAADTNSKFNPNTPVWVNVETGEMSWTDMSGIENWEGRTAEEFFTDDFTALTSDFINDWNNYKTADKIFQAKINIYENMSDKTTNEAEKLSEELDNRYDELVDMEENIKTKYASILGGMEISDIFTNDLLNSLDYNAELVESIGRDNLPVQYIKFSLKLENNSQFDRNRKGDISNSWELLYAKSPVFATYLYMYNFFTRGFDVGINVFGNAVPVQVLEALGLKDNYTYLNWIRGLVNGDIGSPSTFKINNFLKLFYRNNYSNYELVKAISDATITSSLSGNVNSFKDSMSGVNVELKSSRNAETITVKVRDGIESTVFALKDGATRKLRDGRTVASILPAFTIKVNKGNYTTTELYVLTDTVHNEVDVSNPSLEIEYEKIDLPTDRYTLSYSSNVLARADDSTVLSSLTSNTEVEYRDRSIVSSAEGEIVRSSNSTGTSLYSRIKRRGAESQERSKYCGTR